MQFKEICLPLFFLGFIFYPDFSFAAPSDSQTPININIDFGPIVSAINDNTKGITNNLASIPTNIFDFFKNYLEDSLKSFSSPLPSLATKLILENPDITKMKEAWSKIVLILSTLYALVLLISGLLLTLSFLGAEKRVQAKEWLKGALLMIILIGASYELYALTLKIFSEMANYFIAYSPNNLFVFNVINFNLIEIIFFAIAASFATFSLFIRYIGIAFNTLLFPIALFMYFTLPLKPFGKAALYFILSLFAIQPIDALILLALSSTNNIFSQNSLIWLSMNMLFLGFVNLMIIFFSIIISGYVAFYNKGA